MEKHAFVDQRRRQVEQYIAAHRDQLARQGSVVASWRRRGQHPIGPYYRLTCRSADGKQVAVYLGPGGALVADVREILAQLQERPKVDRTLDTARRHIRRELETAKKSLAGELAQVGLFLKGSEIRGWRRRQKRSAVPALNAGLDPETHVANEAMNE